jgi:hypothetical protein
VSGIPANDEIRASATVVADAANEIPIGGQLKFKNDRFRFDYTGPPMTLKNWDAFRGVILMMHVGDEQDQIIVGSGVLIGPGIAYEAWS